MNKKFLSLALAGLMSASLLTGCLSSKTKTPAAGTGTQPAQTGTTAPANANAKVIKVSIGLNNQSPEYLALKEFEKEIETKTNGKYDIQIYSDAQLGDDLKATESTRLGTLEMTAPSTSPLTGMDKELAIFDLPFLFPSAEVAYKVLDGPVGQKMLDNLSKSGLKGLSFWENGYRNVTNSAREITKPADLKGLKIRTMENPIHLATWKALGANPTPMAFSEVFTAMQQKTIDGQENPVTTIYLQKFQEVQKYLTLTGHVYTPFLLLMSQKVWDSIPKEDQAIFQKAAEIGRDFIRAKDKELTDQYVAALEKDGMKVTKLTPDQLKAFQDAVKPVYDQFKDQIGADTVNAVLQEVQNASK